MDDSFYKGLTGFDDLNRTFIYNNEIDFSTIEGYDNSGNTDVDKFYMGAGVITLAAIVLLLIKTHK